MTQPDRILCRCRVCDSRQTTHLCDTHNEHSGTVTISHHRCDVCGSVFVGNAIGSEELGVAYSTLNSKKYYEEIKSDNQKKMTTAIDHLKRFVSNKDDILDLGTGDGFFVKRLNEAGFENVSAHEIQGSDLTQIREIATQIYQDFDYSSIPSDHFHAVTLLDVVEHVLDPRYLIKTCNRILKNDGLIYFHTPVVTRTDRLMHCFQRVPLLKKAGIIWQRGRTSIFHLENYTIKSLTNLLETSGFHDIRIEVKNELSWPVTRYIRTYLLEKHGLPTLLAPMLTPLFYPLLATNLFNANKAMVSARKADRAVAAPDALPG